MLISLSAFPQTSHRIKINVSVDKQIKHFKDNGRLLVVFSKSNKQEPIYQRYFSNQRLGFTKNIKNWDGKATKLEVNNTFSSSEIKLDNIPKGKWFVQAIYNTSGKRRFTSAGNIYSEVVPILISEEKTLDLHLSKTIKSRIATESKDTELVKYITLKSKLLSDFWNKPMNTEASVLLPRNFDKNSSKQYPIRINIGGYGSSCTRATRLANNKEFIDWWLSEDAPEFINIFLNGDGPLGDPYYLDSENSGPYGSALTEELIPYIEKEFNCIGTPEYRFLDGCSTGGWVSFALQVFYPDYFNGAWSFSADPVDFHHMQLVNMYNDKSAFQNQYTYLTPSIRSKTGQPRVSMKDEVAGENINSFDNTYTTSGGQWGGWNALYSPKGKDGLPVSAFHPVTGEIDSVAVKNWKKYDLLKIMQNNWPELGSKLQGKLWIWMGDMDQFYLNNAMREMDKFLKSTTNPKSVAIVIFEPMKGHCEEFDHRWVLEMIQEKVESLK
jgi:S-formylglutathione hydrolase FrmB